MVDQDRLDDLLRQAADLRARSARVRARADQIMAKSRHLVTWISEVHQETGHAPPDWPNSGLTGAARKR